MGGALVLMDPYRLERHEGSRTKLMRDGTLLGKNKTVLGRRIFEGDWAHYEYTAAGREAIIRQSERRAEMEEEEGEEEQEEY